MTSQNDGNKIYLTEQEAERIQSTVKARLQRCTELSGYVRNPRDPKAAISQATGASLMADMGNAPDPDTVQTSFQGDMMPVLAVGQPYPPSITSSQKLQPIKISDLQMETHHRGRRLVVKRVSPVVILAARSWTMVQDENGEGTERFEICLHKTRFGNDVLESATTFEIKEPYFTLTDQGEATIRVDHPSDLVTHPDHNHGQDLNFDNEETPYESKEAEKLAERYKEEGNEALRKSDPALAYSKYSHGLEIARKDNVLESTSDLAKDIVRNRAHVNLLLNRFDEAKADAIASLTGREDDQFKALDSKAYFRAGLAAYNLGEFEEAKSLLKEQQRLTPGDKDAIMNLRRIEMRFRERQTGIYELEKIRAALSRARPRVDAASFVNRTEVRESPGRGRGFFAVENISEGEILMCEKAFCVVWSHENEAMTAMTYDVRDDRIRASPVGLTASIVQRLLNNPSQIARVMDLYGDYSGDRQDVLMAEDDPIVDVFRVHDIMSRNAFGPGSQYGEENARNASTGLWIRASYINHSCIPNAKREYIGDLMVLRAVRSIAAGEEIFQMYDESTDYDARQAALMTTWGFECDCALCIAEKADGIDLRTKRRELVKEAKTFVAKEHALGAQRLKIVRAERLTKAIENTYDEKRYEGLPKMAGYKIREWLAQASPKR